MRSHYMTCNVKGPYYMNGGEAAILDKNIPLVPDLITWNPNDLASVDFLSVPRYASHTAGSYFCALRFRQVISRWRIGPAWCD